MALEVSGRTEETTENENDIQMSTVVPVSRLFQQQINNLPTDRLVLIPSDTIKYRKI